MEGKNIGKREGVSIQQYRENIAHGTPQFPMQVYKNDFDWYTNHIIDWHWHPEIEFAVVLKGSVECYINDTCIQVNEGEGFFINSNTMHMERPISGDEKPLMTTVCFMPDLIGDSGADLIYQKFVRPIVTDPALKGMKLIQGVEWQKKILSIVVEIFRISEQSTWGYELKFRNLLGELWYNLSLNLGKDLRAPELNRTATVNENRLKEMLTFIHMNYQREISVDEIAKAANISKSECFRCFRRMIGKKPVTYLNEHRLKHAVNLLISTDKQITEICFACGFNHISYFGKIFKQYYAMTPKQFRKENT